MKEQVLEIALQFFISIKFYSHFSRKNLRFVKHFLCLC